MEKSFHLISYPLSFCGFNIFSEYSTIWHILRRGLYFSSTIAIVCCAFYCALIDEQTTFSNRIFLTNTFLGFSFITFQAAIFWKNKKKLLDITKQVILLQKDRDEKWVKLLTKPLFDKCSKKVLKMTK